MKSVKFLTAILALGLLFGACKKEEDKPAEGSKGGMNKAAGTCVATESMTKAEFDAFGSLFSVNGNGQVAITDGLALEKRQGNQHFLIFGNDVPRGTIEVAVGSGNDFTKYTFNSNCYKGEEYPLGQVSAIRYDEFVPSPLFIITFVDLDGGYLCELEPALYDGVQKLHYYYDLMANFPNFWEEFDFKIPAGYEAVPNIWKVLEGNSGHSEPTYEYMMPVLSDLTLTLIIKEVPKVLGPAYSSVTATNNDKNPLVVPNSNHFTYAKINKGDLVEGVWLDMVEGNKINKVGLAFVKLVNGNIEITIDGVGTFGAMAFDYLPTPDNGNIHSMNDFKHNNVAVIPCPDAGIIYLYIHCPSMQFYQ
jgi:hypothetical protein